MAEMHKLRVAPELSVVVPVYNEETSNLYRLIEKLQQVLQPLLIFYEIVFVDDGSCVATNQALRELALQHSYIKVVVLSRNFGELAAITAGLNHAVGQVVINLDSDSQDPPELIPTMLQYWRSGYDVVYTQQVSRQESWLKMLCAHVFYRVLGCTASLRIPMDAGEFRLLSRRVIDALAQLPEKSRFLRGLVPWIGFKQITIPFHRGPRTAGKSQYQLKQLLQVGIAGILSCGATLLYVIPVLGLALLVMGLLGLAVAIGTHIALIGGVSLFLWSTLLVLAGLQIGCIGIVGLYLSYNLDETRRRPTYIVAEVVVRDDCQNIKTLSPGIISAQAQQ